MKVFNCTHPQMSYTYQIKRFSKITIGESISNRVIFRKLRYNCNGFKTTILTTGFKPPFYTSMNRSLIIIFLFFPFILSAQTFSFDPGGEIEDQVNFDEYSVHQIDILNETSDTLQLSWKLVEKTFPEGWEVTLCDNVACYGGLPNSNDFYPIFDDNNGFVKLTVNPFQVSGTLEFVFLIFPTGDQNASQEMRFTLTAGETTATNAPTSVSIKIWPNPVSDMLYLKNNDNAPLLVNLTNVTGQNLQSLLIQPQNQKEISVEHLENGMYFLKYFADKKFLGAKPFIKQ